jgi:uncharacterized coiled-coil protein SlyX
MSDLQNTRTIQFDGKVTLALVLAVVLEAIAGLMWVGAAAQRLDTLETRVASQATLVERMARIEAQMTGVRTSLDRIENHLDRKVSP